MGYFPACAGACALALIAILGMAWTEVVWHRDARLNRERAAADPGGFVAGMRARALEELQELPAEAVAEFLQEFEGALLRQRIPGDLVARIIMETVQETARRRAQ